MALVVKFDKILDELREDDTLPSSSYVASITGTANQVLANGTSGSAQTGAVTLTLPDSVLINTQLSLEAQDTMVLNSATIASQLAINSNNNSIIEMDTSSATFFPIIYGARSRGAVGAKTIIQNGDTMMSVIAVGYDGTDYAIGGSISFSVSATPGSNDMPTTITFATSADGSQTPVSRMTISHTGLVTITDTLNVTNHALAGGYGRIGSTSAPAANATGNLTVDSYLTVGSNTAVSGAARVLNLAATSTATSGGETSTFVQFTLAPTGSTSSEYRAINFRNLVTTNNTYTSGTTGGIEGGFFENRVRGTGLITALKGIVAQALVVDSSSASTAQATNVWGLDVRALTRASGSTTTTVTTAIGIETANIASNTGGFTVTTLNHFHVSNPGSNTYTSVIGLDVDALTRGTTDNIGVRIAEPSGATNNRALHLTSTSGNSPGGIHFGTDIQMWRVSANLLTLGTGDSFRLDGGDLVTDTSTGMKIGTATNQKLGFWGQTPIVQPTTAIAAATFVANTSGIVDDSATFDGYTIGQVVKALRNEGLLA